jgi:hypothetical protein
MLGSEEQMASMQSVAVIVAQAGADVCGHVEAAQGHGTVELLQQSSGESETQLSQRLRSRLSALHANGTKVSTASFVARGGFGMEDVLSAASLVRGMVALMVTVGAGTVRLHASPRDRQAEVALTALTEALEEQLRGTGVALEADLRHRADGMTLRAPCAPVSRPEV